jgi:hypothetical protein
MSLYSLRTILASLALCMSTHAAAQMSMPMTSPLAVDMMIDSEDAKSSQRPNQSVRKQPTPQQFGSLNFTSSRDQQKANWNELVVAVQRIDANQGKALRKLVDSADWNAEYGKLMRKFNLNPQNMGDVFGLWVLAMWQTHNNVQEDLTPQQAQTSAEQFRQKFAANPDFVNQTNAQKQKFVDNLMIQTIAMSLAVGAAKNDPSKMPAVQAAAKRNAMDVGVDLETIQWTSTGFVPARKGKRGDAGDAIEGANPAAAGSQMAEASDARIVISNVEVQT